MSSNCERLPLFALGLSGPGNAIGIESPLMVMRLRPSPWRDARAFGECANRVHCRATIHARVQVAIGPLDDEFRRGNTAQNRRYRRCVAVPLAGVADEHEVAGDLVAALSPEMPGRLGLPDSSSPSRRSRRPSAVLCLKRSLCTPRIASIKVVSWPLLSWAPRATMTGPLRRIVDDLRVERIARSTGPADQAAVRRSVRRTRTCGMPLHRGLLSA